MSKTRAWVLVATLLLVAIFGSVSLRIWRESFSVQQLQQQSVVSRVDACAYLQKEFENASPALRTAMTSSCLLQDNGACKLATADGVDVQMPYPLWVGKKTDTGMISKQACLVVSSNASSCKFLDAPRVAKGKASAEPGYCEMEAVPTATVRDWMDYVPTIATNPKNCPIEFDPIFFYRPLETPLRTLEATYARTGDSVGACSLLMYELDDMRATPTAAALPTLYFVAEKILRWPAFASGTPNPYEQTAYRSPALAGAFTRPDVAIRPDYARVRVMSGATLLAEFDFKHVHPARANMGWFSKSQLVRMRFMEDPVVYQAADVQARRNLRVQFDDAARTAYSITEDGAVLFKREASGVITAAAAAKTTRIFHGTHLVVFAGYRVDPGVLKIRNKGYGVQLNGGSVQLLVDRITDAASLPYVGKFTLGVPLKSATYTAQQLLDRFGEEFPTRWVSLGRTSVLAMDLKAVAVPRGAKVTLVGKRDGRDVYAVLAQNDSTPALVAYAANLNWPNAYFTSLIVEAMPAVGKLTWSIGISTKSHPRNATLNFDPATIAGTAFAFTYVSGTSIYCNVAGTYSWSAAQVGSRNLYLYVNGRAIGYLPVARTLAVGDVVQIRTIPGGNFSSSRQVITATRS